MVDPVLFVKAKYIRLGEEYELEVKNPIALSVEDPVTPLAKL